MLPGALIWATCESMFVPLSFALLPTSRGTSGWTSCPSWKELLHIRSGREPRQFPVISAFSRESRGRLALLTQEHGVVRRPGRHGEADRAREEGQNPQTGQKPNANWRKRTFNFGFIAFSEAMCKVMFTNEASTSKKFHEGFLCRLPWCQLTWICHDIWGWWWSQVPIKGYCATIIVWLLVPTRLIYFCRKRGVIPLKCASIKIGILWSYGPLSQRLELRVKDSMII